MFVQEIVAMPRFFPNQEKNRSLTLAQGVMTSQLAIFMCKSAQSKLDCFGRYNVSEKDDDKIEITFTGDGADTLFEDVHNWCKTITEISPNIPKEAADAISQKIVASGIDAYTFFLTIIEDDNEEEQDVIIVFGNDVSYFVEQFNNIAKNYNENWSKNQLVIKSAVNCEGADALIKELDQSIDAYIYASPIEQADPKKQSFSSNITVFGENKADLLKEFKRVYDKYVFQDTPLVLSLILMGKVPTKMNKGETILVNNGRSTVIIPCSDDEEKNASFYNELFNLRSRCVEREIDTKKVENGAVHIMLKENSRKHNNKVFHFVGNGKVFLRGLPEDVEPFKKSLKDRLNAAIINSEQALSR